MAPQRQIVAHPAALGDHIGRRRRIALLAEEHRRTRPTRTKEFQVGSSFFQTATYTKSILETPTGLTFHILRPAADADAALTEFKAGFALRLRAEERFVYQWTRLLAVVALLLWLLLLETFRAEISA